MLKLLGAKRQTPEALEKLRDLKATLAALQQAQAVISFDLDGTIREANANFLATMGYSADEIIGRHHRMFVTPEDAASPDYARFWERLGRGEYISARFKRIGKGGREIWIEASYNPLIGDDGRPYRVTKFATDVTEAERDRISRQQERTELEAIQAHCVGEVAKAAAALASGDLTFRIAEHLPDVFGRLQTDFNDASTRLQGLMSNVVETSGGIRSGSREISQAADDLSRRTEQQAASLEETAAALEEITATVKQTAEAARQAQAAVSAARTDADASGRVVQNAVSAMGEIEASSSQIGQIIGVIDEIAFQTNLLALNAGVEAARAGDAGKGFAVVASEVRALAQRSAEAAKQIKALINASTQQVSSGVELVGQTGQALQRIVTQVAQITELVTGIAASAQEQSGGLQEVNSAVNQMDQMTQQNAAMVEQTTAASHALAHQAEDLGQLMDGFQIGAAAQPNRSPPARPSGGGSTGQSARARAAVARRPIIASEPDRWEEF